MTKIKLQSSDWKIKTIERSRGRMKLIVKLSKDEADGFKNWTDAIKPDTVNQDDFIKQIFFNGIEHLNMKIQQMSEQLMKEIKEKNDASGIPTQPSTETQNP
jgi:hypothetical protein